MLQIRGDILRRPGARWLLARPWLPVALQVVALGALAALVANGWGVGPGRSPADLLTLRKTNLTTLFVWGVFWPGLVILTLLVGRVWCTVCPLELSSRIGGALARRIGLARTAVPRWLRAGWAIVVGYALLQVLVAGASIHRVPDATSLMLLALVGLALGAGLVFREPRAFCTTLCPVATLLSVYGRTTAMQLEIRDPDRCASCTSRDCVRPEHRDRFDRRSCPSLLRPYDRAPGDGCVLCLQCAKVCPSENVGFGLVAPSARVRRRVLLTPAEATFIAVAAGFVGREVITEAHQLETIWNAVPAAAARVLGIGFGWVEAAWFLVLVPALLWTLIAVLARLGGQRGGWRPLLLGAVTAAAPIIAVAHGAKALAKLGAWVGYLPQALHDPRGLATFESLTAHRLAAPARLVGLPTLGGVMLVALTAMAVHAWRRPPTPESRRTARISVAVIAALFMAVMAAWLRG